MGVQFRDKVHVPQSTGAVETPTEPIQSGHAYRNDAADGAAKTPAKVTTKVTHGPDAVVRFPTPTEPVRFGTDWVGRNTEQATEVPQAETKVIGPPKKRAPRKSAAKPETKTQS